MVNSAGPGYSPHRILVVDDDPDILRLVSAKLDRAGFDVFTASSGQRALDMIERRGLPHLAIVDIMMPEMDGFEFCQTVQLYSDLPVIMLTAVDEEETVIRGIELYAEDYVTKPFSPRELTARVRRVLRRIGEQTLSRWPVRRIVLVHRVGLLEPGEASVAIVLSTPHRAQGFEALRFCIESIKKDAPIWKKEHFEDGEVWVQEGP